MKAVLGCLLCLVLTMSQGFAISGGPWSGGGHVTVTGTYAGALIPKASDPTQNTIALFTLVVPKTGLGSGTLAIFTNGVFYPGTIQAIADPDSAKLFGVLNGSFTRTVSSGLSTIVFTSLADGRFSGDKIKANKNSFSSASVRIRGDATLTYGSDDPIVTPLVANGLSVTYTIIGFKQTEATS